LQQTPEKRKKKEKEMTPLNPETKAKHDMVLDRKKASLIVLVSVVCTPNPKGPGPMHFTRALTMSHLLDKFLSIARKKSLLLRMKCEKDENFSRNILAPAVFQLLFLNVKNKTTFYLKVSHNRFFLIFFISLK
jgi:hypothetical protein